MIVSSLLHLCYLLQKLPIGKYCAKKNNYVELISDDPDITNELNKHTWMKGFIAKLEYRDDNAKFYLVRIFQRRTMNDYNIEQYVEQDFSQIFALYNEQIDFMYCPNIYTIILETEDLELVQKIYIEILKNYGYAQIGNMHIFRFLVE